MQDAMTREQALSVITDSAAILGLILSVFVVVFLFIILFKKGFFKISLIEQLKILGLFPFLFTLIYTPIALLIYLISPGIPFLIPLLFFAGGISTFPMVAIYLLAIFLLISRTIRKALTIRTDPPS